MASPIPVSRNGVGVACQRCRHRRTFCSKDRPACSSCLAGKHECLYVEPEKKVAISEAQWAYYQDLERELQALKSTRAGSHSSQSVTPTSALSIPHVAGSHALQNPEIDVNPLLEGMTDLCISPSGTRQYLGTSSSASLGLRLRDTVRGWSQFPSFSIEEQRPTYTPAAWSSRQPSILRVPKYPREMSIARRLYAAQYAYIGTIFAFLPPPVFEQRLQQVYSGPPNLAEREACLAHCQILLIFAFGKMYSVNHWDGDDGPPGFDFFMDALQFLPDVHEEGSLLFVEVLSLAGYFMQTLNRRDAAFIYLGIAMRMAIYLGLHQESSDHTIDEAHKEYRRRLWWSVYSLDRIICAKSGLPITIADGDVNIAAPSRLVGLEPEYCPAVVLLHYTELSRILGRITKSIYGQSRKSGSSLITTVQTIMSDLFTWHRNIPQELRFDFSKLGRPISREAVSTYLHYYQCINATARPLLFHVVQKRLLAGEDVRHNDWRQDYSQATLGVIDSCIAAARDATTMLACAAQQNLVATYGWMDGEHAFSSCIVLVMANIALTPNPVDYDAMQLALGVLEGMAGKGNTYIETRLRLLRELSSWIPHDTQNVQVGPADVSQGQSFAPWTGTMLTFDAMTLASQHDDFSVENMFPTDGGADIGLWEEGYGNPSHTVEFTWEQFSEVARNAI